MTANRSAIEHSEPLLAGRCPIGFPEPVIPEFSRALPRRMPLTVRHAHCAAVQQAALGKRVISAIESTIMHM
jgi:hypothetical protein